MNFLRSSLLLCLVLLLSCFSQSLQAEKGKHQLNLSLSGVFDLRNAEIKIEEDLEQELTNILTQYLKEDKKTNNFIVRPLKGSRAFFVSCEKKVKNKAECRHKQGINQHIDVFMYGYLETVGQRVVKREVSQTKESLKLLDKTLKKKNVKDILKLGRSDSRDLKNDRPLDLILDRKPVSIRPQMRKSTSRGRAAFRLTIFLEKVEADRNGHQLVDAFELKGDLAFIKDRMAQKVSDLLNNYSPKNLIAMRRLEQMAQVYQEAGRIKDAERSFRRALSVTPYHPEAARVSLKMVKFWRNRGKILKALELEKDVLRKYGPGSLLYDREIMPKEQREALLQTLVTDFYNDALAAHAVLEDEQAAKKEKTSFDDVINKYMFLLNNIESFAEKEAVLMSLAELYYNNSQLETALSYYTQVLELAKAEQGDLARRNAIWCLESLMIKDSKVKFSPEKDVRKIKVSSQKIDYNQYELDYLLQIEKLYFTNPKYEDLDVLLYKSVVLAVLHGQKKDAAKIYKLLRKTFRRKKSTKLAKILLGK